MKTYTQKKQLVRVQVCSEKNIFFVRTNRKLKVCLKNRKNPDKIRAFLWLYLFCSLFLCKDYEKDISAVLRTTSNSCIKNEIHASTDEIS